MSTTPPNPNLPTTARQRRAHRKSRNGCLQCKQKKIKCDETRPSCGHCTRLRSTCSLSGQLSPLDATSRPLASPRTSDLNGGPSVSASNVLASHLSASNGPAGSLSTVQSELDVSSLELLHFYTTTTSLTLSNNPQLQRIWQQGIPLMAFTHSFLLHGLLAFSALHLARSQPDRKSALYAQASAHHHFGLTMFRTATLNISPQNFDACLTFSTIIAAYAWASSDQTADLFFADGPASHESRSVDWASLLRGVYTLLEATEEWMNSSSINQILHPPIIDPALAGEADKEVGDKLGALSQLWVASPGKFSPAETATLDATLSLIQSDYRLITSPTTSDQVDLVSILYAWPIKVPEAFLIMVRELRPEALIVLAHYSLLLNKADQIWFMRGMSRRLLQSVHSKLGVDWQSWIAWPLQNLVLTEFKDPLHSS